MGFVGWGKCPSTTCPVFSFLPKIMFNFFILFHTMKRYFKISILEISRLGGGTCKGFCPVQRSCSSCRVGTAHLREAVDSARGGSIMIV